MKFELKSGFIPTPFNHERHENSRKRTNTLHHEGHEVNEVNPGSAGRLTGFMHFAFGDQRLVVGSRPAGRRWQVKGNNYLFAGPVTAGRTVPPDFRQCEGLGVDSRKQTDAVLAYCKAKLTRKICPNGAIARKSGSPSRPSSGTFPISRKI